LPNQWNTAKRVDNIVQICWCGKTKNLHVIQDKLSESPLFIAAADVKGLYPNLRRDIVQRALSRALGKHSKFSADAREVILQLNNVCLSNVITQFGNNFYIQGKAIVTGDNHSVTLANITVHYVLELLRPGTQLYGQVRTDWNQCFVIDCSLSHLAGHKPFTCSHSVLCNTWLNIHAIRWMRFSARLSVHVLTTSRNLTWSLFVSSAVSELSSAWSI